MKIISSKLHGVLDYLVGLLLIMAPWLLNFAQNGAETWTPVILGSITILYSLFTKYELGAVKIIPFRTHLTFDFVSGLILAASPWLFAFAGKIYTPHLLAGILEMVVVICTLPASPPARITKHTRPTGASALE
jgi:hypothetical protein